jgi:peptide/nickel transport system substrate-binding protein
VDRHEYGAPELPGPKGSAGRCSYAVNVDAVLEAAYFGVAKRATGIIAPGLPGHREKNVYGYDPEKAKALLKEAGKSDLQTTLSVLNKATNLSAAQIVQANLADVGVKLEILPV